MESKIREKMSDAEAARLQEIVHVVVFDRQTNRINWQGTTRGCPAPVPTARRAGGS